MLVSLFVLISILMILDKVEHSWFMHGTIINKEL